MRPRPYFIDLKMWGLFSLLLPAGATQHALGAGERDDYPALLDPTRLKLILVHLNLHCTMRF
jgi:hypothetical protein